jgi:hypothetical protein
MRISRTAFSMRPRSTAGSTGVPESLPSTRRAAR